MSAEQLNEFKATYGPKQEGLVWHLPVDGKRFIDVRRSPKRGSIISVGRLERMKEYNLYMIGVIKNLLKKGYDVTWTVYGDGTFEKEMRKRIADESLQERIHLKGRLEYSQFGEVLTNAYLFVGMGTAIIEASFCKVPGVVAMAYDTKGATYGPLYKFPLGNSGEFMEFPASSTVESEIERIMKMSSDEYAQEMNLVQAYAEHYGIDNQMEAFMGIVRQAQVAKKDLPLILSYYFYNYFCFPKFRFRFRSRFACRTL